MATDPSKPRKRPQPLSSKGPIPLHHHDATVPPVPSPSSSDDFSQSQPPSSSRIAGCLKLGNKVRINVGLVTSGSEYRELKLRLGIELERVRKFRRKIEGGAIKPSDDFSNRKDENVRTATRVNSEVSCVGPSCLGAEIGEDEGSKQAKEGQFSQKLVKKCGEMLAKLMRHQYGWVFNAPVDAKKLKLHDYYTIIKNPMDLGTVKTRLSKSWYKSPKEFAEDVRLTFNNALTYNEKGQDVHHMADVLLKLFDGMWGEVQQELRKSTKVSKKAKGSVPDTSDVRLKSQKFDGLGGVKANRSMKFEEKQRLSSNLQSLPSDELETVVQIIKKRNPDLFQEENEIEVDIDSFDDQTLWELYEFVNAYFCSIKKNASENLVPTNNGHRPDKTASGRMSASNLSNSSNGSFSKDTGDDSSS